MPTLMIVESHPIVNCCNQFHLCGEGVPVVVLVFEGDHSDSAPELSNSRTLRAVVDPERLEREPRPVNVFGIEDSPVSP